MKLTLPALSGLAAVLAVVMLAGCAAQSSTSSSADTPAAPVAATAPAAPAAATQTSPQPAAPALKKVSLTTTVYFDNAKSALNKQAKAEIDDLLSKIQGLKLEVIIAVGRTDGKGSASANEKLGMRRANAVKDYLMSKGIAANRVYTDSRPDQAATAGDKTKDARANKRRVEIEAIVYRAN